MIVDFDYDRLAEAIAARIGEPSSEWLTIDEAADHLKVGKRFIEERIAGDSIPHHRLGRLVRLNRAELDRWAEQQ